MTIAFAGKTALDGIWRGANSALISASLVKFLAPTNNLTAFCYSALHEVVYYVAYKAIKKVAKKFIYDSEKNEKITKMLCSAVSLSVTTAAILSTTSSPLLILAYMTTTLVGGTFKFYGHTLLYCINPSIEKKLSPLLS